MFKKSFVFGVLFTALLCASSVQAFAQTSRVYFASYMGLNTFNARDFKESTAPSDGTMELNNSTSFAGALGIRLSEFTRLEGELSFGNSSFSSINLNSSGLSELGGEIKATLAMMNIYYDFDVPWDFQPFVSAGLGLGWYHGDIGDNAGPAVEVSDKATGIAWQMGGGVKYRMGPDFALTGGYRYVDGTDIDLGSYSIDYGAHEFRVGMEYDLPIQ